MALYNDTATIQNFFREFFYWIGLIRNNNGALPVSSTGDTTTLSNLIKSEPITMGATHCSPKDFQVYYDSPTTLSCSGAPFTIDNTNCTVLSITVIQTGSASSVKYVNAHGGYTITASSNKITLAGATTPFASTDVVYRVAVSEQNKAYDATLKTYSIQEISPVNEQLVLTSFLDATNLPSGVTNYPSVNGLSMDNYRDFSLTGKIIDGDGTITVEVQVTNDEDIANADWVTIYGYCAGTNTVCNTQTVTNSTLNFAWFFDNLNVSYLRIRLTNVGPTSNTVILKGKQKAV